MSLNTLKDLFYNRLNDIYDAEKQLAQIMPVMAQAAQNDDLRTIFQSESEAAANQLYRLDEVFQSLGLTHDSVRSQGMHGIIEEGEDIIHQQGDPTVKDAALIAIAQEMKHYEMATYGAVRSWARELDYPDVAGLLQDSLDDEGNTDKKLSTLAQGSIFTRGINKRMPR
jgi:ferritin-like metal-binding protein YciE